MGLFNFLRGGSRQDRFAQRVMERLIARGWTRPIRYDRQRFAIQMEADDSTMFLANIYRDWTTYPDAEQDGALDRAIDYMFELDLDESYEAVAEHLLPVIRNRTLMNLDRPADQDASAYQGATRIFGEQLVTLAAIDRPNSIRLIGSELLALWGRSLEDVLATATENLRARSPCRFNAMDGGFYVSVFEDHHDASRLLLPHLFGLLPLKGAPVVTPIARSCIVVAGRDDPTALAAMARFVENAIQVETRPISFAPMILQDETWSPLEPAPYDPTGLHRLVVHQRLWEYAEQARTLQAHLRAVGRELFASPLEPLAADGRKTWTRWSQDVSALLPRADTVALTDAAGRTLARRWEDVEAACGPFQPEPGLYPPRYLAERWPAPAAWDRLAACPAPVGFVE